MSLSQSSQPTFLSVAPRFIVHDMEQALADLMDNWVFRRRIMMSILLLLNGMGWTCI
jgi:hypothetical protein